MAKKKWISYIQMTGAILLAGSSVVAAKMLCTRLPVFLSQGMSLLLALPIMLIYRMRKKPQDTWTRKNRILIGLQALFGMVGFRVCLLYGMRHISAAAGGIILGSTPAVLGLLSYVFLRERPSAKGWLGVLFAIAAVMSLQTFGAETGDRALLGGLLLLLTVVGEALLTIFRKQMDPGVSIVSNVTFVILAAFVLFLPFSAYEAFQYDWSLFGWAEAALVLYYGVCVTALAYLLWFSGIEDTPGHVAAVFTGVAPVSSVLLAACFGETLRPIHGLSTLLLLIGIWGMARDRGENKKHVSTGIDSRDIGEAEA